MLKSSPKYELPTSMPQLVGENQHNPLDSRLPHDKRGFRPIEEVTCFKVIIHMYILILKCGEKGHFANHCPNKRKID